MSVQLVHGFLPGCFDAQPGSLRSLRQDFPVLLPRGTHRAYRGYDNKRMSSSLFPTLPFFGRSIGTHSNTRPHGYGVIVTVKRLADSGARFGTGPAAHLLP